MAGEGLACRAEEAVHGPLLRMDRLIYGRAVAQIFGDFVPHAIGNILPGVPIAALDHAPGLVSPSEVESHIELASAVGFALSESVENLRALHPCLGQAEVNRGGPQTASCVADFIAKVGPRVLRRPLNDADRAQFEEAYQLGAEEHHREGVATLVMTWLMSPEFLYFLEIAGPDIGDDRIALTGPEVAARLSRALWRSIPDDELAQVAQDGFDAAEIRSQVQRMLAHPAAGQAMRELFSGWLQLDRLAIPQSYYAGLVDTEALRLALVNETLDFVEGEVFQGGGGYGDLLLQRQSHFSDPRLAEVYGVPMNDDGTFDLPADQRAGLLTRAAWLVTPDVPRSNGGHLIKRGVKLARFLCLDLPAPAADNIAAAVSAMTVRAQNLDVRSRFNAVTKDRPCSACHDVIEPFGAPFGHYGSAGQWLDRESLFMGNAGTQDVAINSASVVSLDGVEYDIPDALALSEQIAKSEIGPSCMAQQLVQLVNGHGMIGTPAAGCAQTLSEDLLRGGDDRPGASIVEVLSALVLSPAFSQQRMVP